MLFKCWCGFVWLQYRNYELFPFGIWIQNKWRITYLGRIQDTGSETDNYLDTGSGTDNHLDKGSETDNYLDTGSGTDNYLDTGSGKDKYLDTGSGTDNYLDTGSGTDEQYWLRAQDSLQQHSGSSQSTSPSTMRFEVPQKYYTIKNGSL